MTHPGHITDLLICHPAQPCMKTTAPGSPSSPLTARSWYMGAGRTTSFGMTRLWIVFSCHLYSLWTLMTRTSFWVWMPVDVVKPTSPECGEIDSCPVLMQI